MIIIIDKMQQIAKMTNLMAKFVSLVSYKLPDDVENKLKELSEGENNPLAKIIYDTMFNNQELAYELKETIVSIYSRSSIFCKVWTELPFDSAIG